MLKVKHKDELTMSACYICNFSKFTQVIIIFCIFVKNIARNLILSIMLERILLILKTKNLTSSQFADKIGVQRSSVSHVLSGRNKPSLEFVQKIFRCYNDINYEWLLTGKGPMMKDHKAKPYDLFNNIDEKKEEKIEVFVKKHVKETHIEQIQDEVTQSEDEIEKEKDAIKAIKPDDPVKPENEIGKMKEIKITPPSITEDNLKKRIERIVVFHTNSTYREYLPEKE